MMRRIRVSDWRIWLGSAITLLWIGVGIFYIGRMVGWEQFWRQGSDGLGSFLEGAFAPLAFLWLVIGLFIQQKELAQNTEELRKTNVQSERQTQAIAATELNARQETFFKIAENVRHQLGGIAGMLYMSSKGSAGDGSISDEQMAAYWHNHSMGDDEVFPRLFLTPPVNREGYAELFYGTEIRTRHSENYLRSFRRLVRLAAECDVDDVIVDSLRDTAHGLLFAQIRSHRPAIEAAPDTPPEAVDSSAGSGLA